MAGRAAARAHADDLGFGKPLAAAARVRFRWGGWVGGVGGRQLQVSMRGTAGGWVIGRGVPLDCSLLLLGFALGEGWSGWVALRWDARAHARPAWLCRSHPKAASQHFAGEEPHGARSVLGKLPAEGRTHLQARVPAVRAAVSTRDCMPLAGQTATPFAPPCQPSCTAVPTLLHRRAPPVLSSFVSSI